MFDLVGVGRFRKKGLEGKDLGKQLYMFFIE
jgi:hypothetical protein